MASIEAIYCHIPFCHSICPFCAFAVHGHRRELHRPYLDALAREFALRSARHDGPRLGVRSVYFGGGTPSTLHLDDWAWLMERLRAAFGLEPDAEIAVECNPEDVTKDYAEGLLRLGFNRFSLGVQSLDDATLRALGRGHDAAQAGAALAALREAGVRNLNVDLMFGAPEIAPDAFRRDLESLLKQPPEHLSLYGLDIEEGTPFGRDRAIRAWSETHREAQAESYLWAAARLKGAGYRHYEVSNFCLPGREGRQNRIVWDGGAYLGFGTGAHSYGDGERWHNQRHVKAYQDALERGELPEAYRERLTPTQRANEALMLALRRDSGLDTAAWAMAHSQAWDERRRRIADTLVREGQACWKGTTLILTAAGFLVADAITEQLMVR